MIPVVENNQAIIKHVSVPNENVKAMPLDFTRHNMANLMSSLIVDLMVGEICIFIMIVLQN